MTQPAYDKYDPIANGFRARLAADLTLNGDGSFLGAVSLNASGKVVPGTGGQSGLVGVLLKNASRGPVGQYALLPGTVNPNAPIAATAGSVVDVMMQGEIVGLDKTAFPAGSKVYTTTGGVLSVTGGTGKFLVGFTIQAGRLHVAVAVGQVAQA
jgi:hypothetical protein